MTPLEQAYDDLRVLEGQQALMLMNVTDPRMDPAKAAQAREFMNYFPHYFLDIRRRIFALENPEAKVVWSEDGETVMLSDEDEAFIRLKYGLSEPVGGMAGLNELMASVQKA